MELDHESLSTALRILEARLRFHDSPPVNMVICGGSALIAMNLVSRTTTDIDILALIEGGNRLVSAVPLPDYLITAIQEVATIRGLPENWLNNGPDFGTEGYLKGDLPDGLLERAHRRESGSHLTVFYIDRIDQIYFKVYASVDRAGVHVDDLMAMEPTPEELLNAARWCVKQDPSEGFRQVLLSMLEQLGYDDVVERLQT